MGQALYRSYRSKKFNEVVGQDHITKTLQEAIKSGRISHAYLFTGPRGVGKTSVARILAREVNNVNAENEHMEMDIIEIDAASNRRIDEIRDLRDKVHISPTSLKYKVYIIDEVHMLTKEAFNALLKTLEEPPEHCIFILATTEAHKLPETIISRTQRFNFKPISQKYAEDHLRKIAKKEKIDIDDEAISLIANYGDGSFRDSISLLDQLGSSSAKVTADLVRVHLGLPKQDIVNNLFELIQEGDAKGVIEAIDHLRYEATDAAAISSALSSHIRQSIKNGCANREDIELLEKITDVAYSKKPYDALEIALLSYVAQNNPKPNQTKTEQVSRLDIGTQPVEEPKVTAINTDATDVAETNKPKEASGSFDLTMWEDALKEVKIAAPSLFTALRLAVPVQQEAILTLYFEFPLHQKKVNSASHKKAIADAINKVSGASLQIICEVNKDIVQNRSQEPEADFYNKESSSDSIDTISNIFGNAEVLES